jgi:pimeloyl-ACP methyl ester carboxylesterase
VHAANYGSIRMPATRHLLRNVDLLDVASSRGGGYNVATMSPLFRLSRVTTAILVGLLLAFTPAAAHAQSHFEGDIGPGSTYEIDVPAGWHDGPLVIYAHGLIPTDVPLGPPSTLPEYPVLRAALLSQGFALAASSYSSNGAAFADAVRRTHQLSGIFNSKVGAPRRTFLIGASMGALVAVKLAESQAGQYDGVLALCGPLGGSLPQLQYTNDGRAIFDFYFPGVLPGTQFHVPDGTVFLSPMDPGGPSPLFLSVVMALANDLASTVKWTSAANLPFNDEAERAASALTFLGYILRTTNDEIDRVNGKIPYDNTDTAYVVDATPDPITNAFLSGVLNDGISRFEADRAALNYVEHNYSPSGRLGAPVLTLHTTRDPIVPFAHETLFGATVAGANRSNLLVQVPIDRWGHCNITPAEIQTAFGSLVQWVETGLRP